MLGRCQFRALFVVLAAASLAGCSAGPSVNGQFDRTFDVSGPVRLELSSSSGDVDIAGSSTDGKIHVHGNVRASGFGNPQQRLDETLSHPPVEQRGSTIRIGKDLANLHNIRIAYSIQVPHDTEIDSSLTSGTQTIRSVRGPLKATAASGGIRVQQIERDAQVSTFSGSIDAADVGDNVRASTKSGSIDIANARGDVQASVLSGSIQISKPGGRVDAETASGAIGVQGATSDVKARTKSGLLLIQGNPGENSFWEVKTASGAVKLIVPSGSNFHLSAQAVSGEIRTDIPIVIEEQDKHSLRARVGNGGSRIEVHTVSGEIRISSGAS
jgi:DUF4097 and DUF4098 domain-containing protein YvlB